MQTPLQVEFYKKIQKLRNKIKYNIVVKSIIPFLLTPILFGLFITILVYIGGQLEFDTLSGEVWYIIFSLTVIVLVPFYAIILVRPIDIIGKWIGKGLYSIYNIIREVGADNYSMEEILQKNNSILIFIKKLSFLNRSSFLFQRETRDAIQEILEDAPIVMVEMIHQLKSQLIQNILEQQVTLESAKSEVEKNITGTPELLAVSEAQKVRLDRQIEQFEELQRVLVKV